MSVKQKKKNKKKEEGSFFFFFSGIDAGGFCHVEMEINHNKQEYDKS